MVSDPSKHLAEVVFGIKAVQLRGFDQRVRRGRSLPTGIRTGKQPVFPAQTN